MSGEDDVNVAIVMGRLSSRPRLSELDSGDLLVRYEVTVARDDGPADSVPVSWLGPAKEAPPSDLEAGEEVIVLGRVRRRWFRTGAGPSRSSTEVVAERVARRADRRRTSAILGRTRTALAAYHPDG